MLVTAVTTSKCSPYYEGSVSIVGSMSLKWEEDLDTANMKSTLRWKLVMNIEKSASGNYGRSVGATTNGINIGGNYYNIPSSGGSLYGDGDTITSGTTEFVHESDGTKVINVSVEGKIGGDRVYGSSSNISLTPITVTNAETYNYNPKIEHYSGSGIPVLYPANVLSSSIGEPFADNGIGRLNGVISCIVTEELNSIYELEMEVFIGSEFYSSLNIGSVIGVIPNAVTSTRTGFEVYEITKNINGTATVRAKHISYRLSYVPYKNTAQETLPQFCNNVSNNIGTIEPSKFKINLAQDNPVPAGLIEKMKIDCTLPQSVRSILGPDTILYGAELWKAENNSEYGIEYEWLNDRVILWGRRGTDRGAEIRYSKNMTSLDAVSNNEDIITGYYPYWTDGDQTVFGTNQYASNTQESVYDYKHTVPFDTSDQIEIRYQASTSGVVTPTGDWLTYIPSVRVGSYLWVRITPIYANGRGTALYTKQYVSADTRLTPAKPTIDTVNDVAAKALENEKLGKLTNSITVSFVDQSNAFDATMIGMVGMDHIALGDTVSVIYSEANVSFKARVTRVEYDVLESVIKSIEVGEPKEYLTSKIIQNTSEIQRIEESRKQYETETSLLLREELGKMEDTAATAQRQADAAREAAENARQEAAEAAANTIVSETMHYLATTLSDNVTWATEGWTTSTQTMSISKPYLWTYKTVIRGNGTNTNTDPVLTGVWGASGPPGAAIVSLTHLYLCSDSPIIPEKPIGHVTNTALEVYNVWGINVQKWTKFYKYYYTCSELLYDTGDYAWTQPVADVQLEETMSHSVVSVTVQYYTSTSDAEPTGGSWLDNYQDAINKAADNANLPEGTPKSEYYIWERSKTTYANDDIVYGDPYLNESLKTTVEASAYLSVKSNAIEASVHSITEVEIGDLKKDLADNYTKTIQLPNVIKSEISNSLKEDGTGTIYEKIKTKVDTATGSLETIKTRVETIEGTVNELDTYFETSDAGLKVSASNTNSYGLFGPNSLDYYVNTSKVAEFGSTKAVVPNELDIGIANSTGWRIYANGDHLTFTRRA